MTLNNNLYRIIIKDAAQPSYGLELIPDCMIYRAHFPEQPITPGVCIIRIATELLEDLYGSGLRLAEVVNAKYLAVIDPDKTRLITYSFKKMSIDEIKSTLKVSVVVSDKDTVFTKLSLVYQTP